MTKRDFELIALAIKEAPIDPASRGRIIDTFIYRLRSTNERFDSEKFRVWATPNEGGVQ